MENNIQLFEHEEFGEVRVVMIDGEPWFVGKDVATALGYTNPQKALRDHVPDKYKTVNDSFTVNGTAPILINEAGMYKLVMRSKLESAEKFSDWVCGDVLISIRKTGSYSVNKNTDSDSFAKAVLKLADAISKLVDVEREKLVFGRARFVFGRARFAFEREHLAFEQEKLNVENREDAIVFKAVDQLIELATLAGEQKYIRLKLVILAANLLVRDNFIEASDINFKKFQ